MKHLPILFMLSSSLIALPMSISAQAAQRGLESKPKLSDAEYSRLLDRMEVDLQTWEPLLLHIDPAKGDPSYSAGKLIEQNKAIALLELSNTRNYIGRERNRRSIYGQLALGQFVETLSGQFYILAEEGAFNDLSVETVSSYAAEISSIQKPLMEDAMNRVQKLEAGPCRKNAY